MPAQDIALIITAIAGLLGTGVASTIMAIAALRNSNYSAERYKDLEKKSAEQYKELCGEVDALKAENGKLRNENDLKTLHNLEQDSVIVQQQSEIHKWYAAFDRLGKKINRLELAAGARQVSGGHDTAPLPPLPDQPSPIEMTENE